MPFEKELIAAVRANRPNEVRHFLSKGANPTAIIEKKDDLLDVKMSASFPMSVLLYAIELGYDEVANAIVEYEPDLNHGNINGYTPLMSATESGKRRWVQRLIELGADLDRAHKVGRKLIFYAAQSELLDVIKICVENGQLPNQGDVNGSTPISLAAAYGRLESVRYLKEHFNADPNQPRNDGWTPLYEAASAGHLRLSGI